jgi:hypothetical protein
LYIFADDTNIKIINATPHDIDLFDDSGKKVLRTFKHNENALIRMEEDRESADSIDGVKTIELSFGKANVPEEKEGTFYIVSNLIANAHPNRRDLLTPALSVRDKDGNIVGCRALGRSKNSVDADKTAGIKAKLNKIADGLEVLNMFGRASEIDGLIKSAQEHSYDRDKDVVNDKKPHEKERFLFVMIMMNFRRIVALRDMGNLWRKYMNEKVRKEKRSMGNEEIKDTDDLEIVVTKFYNNLLKNQEQLGAEFEKILYDNLWDLYEC